MRKSHVANAKEQACNSSTRLERVRADGSAQISASSAVELCLWVLEAQLQRSAQAVRAWCTHLHSAESSTCCSETRYVYGCAL